MHDRFPGRSVVRAPLFGGLRRHRVGFLFLIVALLLSMPAIANDTTFPALSDFVVDTAAMLSPQQRDALSAELRAYKARTGNHVVVATVSDLQGQPIEDFSNKLFRQWKLGTKERNNGVLFLIARRERDMRIEVGYGLEPLLTDETSHLILSRDVKPSFEAGRVDAGVAAGVNDILTTLTPDQTDKTDKARAVAEDTSDAADQQRFMLHAVAVWFSIAGLLIFLGFRARRRRRGSHRHGSTGYFTDDSSSDSSTTSDSSEGDGGSSGGGGASENW